MREKPILDGEMAPMYAVVREPLMDLKAQINVRIERNLREIKQTADIVAVDNSSLAKKTLDTLNGIDTGLKEALAYVEEKLDQYR